MRHISGIGLVLALLLAFAAVSTAQEADPNLVARLTNKEVVEMVKAHLSPEIIVAKIKVSRCNFDIAPPILDELRQKGVPNSVLLAMIEAPYGMPRRAKEPVESRTATPNTAASNIGGVIIPDRNETRSAAKGPTRGRLAIEGRLEAPSDPVGSPKLTPADTLIPRDSTVFVDEMDGFEHYLMAAMRKKSVRLIVVADPMKADFIIFGNADSKRAGWAKMFFLGSGLSGEMAALTMVNRRTKVVVFSDSSYRYNANRGKRSTAEKLAKYLEKKIKQDEKKLKS
jgi:hypothetical protein